MRGHRRDVPIPFDSTYNRVMNASADSQLLYRMRFIHPEKTLADMEGMSDRIAARLFGLRLRRYRSIRRWFDRRLGETADMLLQESDLAAKVQQLPFSDGETVLAVGDSITDDYESWFELLRVMHERVYPNRAVRFVNAGFSGETTTEMVARSLSVVDLKPDFVFCLAGTNDARRHGPDAHGSLVSFDETARNYEALNRLFGTICRARALWLTPPPVFEQAITEHWFLGPMALSWKDADLEMRADAIRRMNVRRADVRRVFGVPANADYLLPDGLHPSPEGHVAMVREIIDVLTGG